MKRYFSVILISSFTIMGVYAQMSGRRAANAEEAESSSTISVRAQNKYGNAEVNTDNLIWMREIYRELDLKNEKNGPLYFPVEPIGDRMNLFTVIFNALITGEISAYEYKLDMREDFADKYKLDVKKDILDKIGIYYETKFSKSSKNPVYQVDNSDIPSSEVLKFYIKEMWYFDQANSTFNSKVLALCPILLRMGDFGSTTVGQPMFWVSYDDVRPYLSQVRVMTSNYNNVANSTYDDYFRQKLYQGDIYNVTNLSNLVLVQYAETDSAMRVEQQRIENEIKAFEKKLWEQPDPNLALLKSKKKLTKSERELLRKLEADENPGDGNANNTSENANVNSSAKKSVKSSSKQPSAKSSKAPKVKSAPTKSVRKR